MPLGKFAAALLVVHLAAAAPFPVARGYRIEGQDSRFAQVFATVEKWIRDGAFPGATLAVGQGGVVVALKAFAHTQ